MLRAAFLLLLWVGFAQAGSAERIGRIHEDCEEDLRRSGQAAAAQSAEDQPRIGFQSAEAALGSERVRVLEESAQWRPVLEDVRTFERALPSLMRHFPQLAMEAIYLQPFETDEESVERLRFPRNTRRYLTLGLLPSRVEQLLIEGGADPLPLSVHRRLCESFEEVGRLRQFRIRDIPRQNFSPQAFERALAKMPRQKQAFIENAFAAHILSLALENGQAEDFEKLQRRLPTIRSQILALEAEKVAKAQLDRNQRMTSNEILVKVGAHFFELLAKRYPLIHKDPPAAIEWLGQLTIEAWELEEAWSPTVAGIRLRILHIFSMMVGDLQQAADEILSPIPETKPESPPPPPRPVSLKPGTSQQRKNAYAAQKKLLEESQKKAEVSTEATNTAEQQSATSSAATEEAAAKESRYQELEKQLEAANPVLLYGKGDRPMIDWEALRHVDLTRRSRDEINLRLPQLPHRCARKVGLFFLLLNEYRKTSKFSKDEAEYFGLGPRHGKPGKIFVLSRTMRLRFDDTDRLIEVLVNPDDRT